MTSSDGLAGALAADETARARASDVELVERLRAGDEAAFAEIVDAWSGAMLQLARAHVSTIDSAQEVVQDAWLGVLRGLDRFEGRSSLKTWVFRIVINTAKTRGSRERRSVPFSAVVDLDEGAGPAVDPSRFRGRDDAWPGHWRDDKAPSPWPVTPEAAIVSAELQGFLLRALDALPARQRAVLVLRDVEGRDAEEVCTLLDVSPVNQRVLLHRARSKARAVIADFYGGQPAM